MKKYECNLCGYVYDEAAGDPDNGSAQDQGYVIALAAEAAAFVVVAHIQAPPKLSMDSVSPD